MIPRHVLISFALLLAGIFVLGLYMLSLKHGAETATLNPGDSVVLAPPGSTTSEAVTLYVAYDDLGVLRKRTTTAALPGEPPARARAILRTLLHEYLQGSSPHPIGAGSDVSDIYIVNQSLAVIDLNTAFADGHRSGVWEETLTVDSMIATLSANMPEVKQVKILVDGKERETLAGHADLITVYDTGVVNQLVQALQ
ncbi:MAG TPA: GerMN domain-containing protein [Terriglobales bacterium]|nr:GerMN domain-containing protein [Terriglobales bacterium]